MPLRSLGSGVRSSKTSTSKSPFTRTASNAIVSRLAEGRHEVEEDVEVAEVRAVVRDGGGGEWQAVEVHPFELMTAEMRVANVHDEPGGPLVGPGDIRPLKTTALAGQRVDGMSANTVASGCCPAGMTARAPARRPRSRSNRRRRGARSTATTHNPR